jgi:hypothetical protein
MRAKELTAGVWAGGDRPFDPVGGGGNETTGGGDDGRCKTIMCFLDFVMKSSVLREWFKRFDFDIEGFRKCVERHCRKEAPATEGRAAVATLPTLTHLPEFGQLVNILASVRVAEPRIIEAAETTPVKRKPRMEGSDENMFLKPEQIKDKPPERPKAKDREKPDK